MHRPASEMAKVGVERLGAGDGEEHRPQRHEADEAVVDEEGRRRSGD